MLIKTKFLKRGCKGTKYKGELRKEKGVFLCKPSAEASLLDYAEAQPKNTKCEALSKVLVLPTVAIKRAQNEKSSNRRVVLIQSYDSTI